MSARKNKSGKRQAKRADGKAPALRAEKDRLERELKELREENRMLKRSLAAMVFKDDPVNLDLKPEDGVAQPTLLEIVEELGKAG
jgi:hypothetical protein